MITITFFQHELKISTKQFSSEPTPKNKSQIIQWIYEGRIKPDDKGFTHFEIS